MLSCACGTEHQADRYVCVLEAAGLLRTVHQAFTTLHASATIAWRSLAG